MISVCFNIYVVWHSVKNSNQIEKRYVKIKAIKSIKSKNKATSNSDIGINKQQSSSNCE